MQDATEPDLRRRTQEIVAAFGAPWCFVKPNDRAEPTILGACVRVGVPYLSTELGGGAQLGADLLGLAVVGCLRVGAALGILEPAPEPAAPVTWLLIPGESHYVYSPVDGVFEQRAELGARVAGNDMVGLVHTPTDPLRSPIAVTFPVRRVRLRPSGRQGRCGRLSRPHWVSIE